ncbi:MAG: glycosyltransferase family 8 protein [Mycoplasmoidaceae bacterium]
MIKIVYACNDGYFDGLYLSILSIVRRTRQPISFYLLSGDFTDLDKKYTILSNKHSKIINDLVKEYNSKSSFEVLDCTDLANKYIHVKHNKHFSPYANLRLLMHFLKPLTDKLIYLDSDVMVCGDINELYNINVDGYELAACHNWWFRHTLTKNTFNSGVLLINMDECKKTDYFNKALALLNSHSYKWADQTALNKAATKMKYFPGNDYRFNRQSEKIHKGDVIKHFCNRWRGWPFWCNIKQWDVKNVHKHLKIFIFDEDYKIWKESKTKNKE